MERIRQIQTIIEKLKDATPAVIDLGSGRKQWYGDFNLTLTGRDVCWLVNYLKNQIYVSDDKPLTHDEAMDMEGKMGF